MQTQIELVTPSVDFDAIKNFVSGYEVATPDSYLLASNELITLKRRRQEIVTFFAEMKGNAHATWKAIVAREKFFTDQIDTYEAILKKKMLAFQQEQERVRRETELRLQAEANMKADEERKHLLMNAKQNEKRGNDLNAEMYRNAAENVVAPVVTVTTQTPKAAGITTREIWKAEIVNKSEFIAAAMINPALEQFISIDTNTLVKQGWRECAGVRFYKEQVMYARSN